MNKVSVGVKKILLYHVVFIIICALVMTPVTPMSTASIIVGGIAVFFYAIAMYSAGWNFGKLDSRRTADTLHSDTPKYLHGEKLNVRFRRMVKASLIAMIPTLILLGTRMILPYFSEEIIVTWSEITDYRIIASVNIAYRLWVAPFNPFFMPFEYGITFIYFLPLIFMPIFVPIGYKVGLTRFTFSEKVLPKIIYKNKKKNN